MFAIYCTSPVYDNCDRFIGSEISRVQCGFFQTAAEAETLKCVLEESEGWGEDGHESSPYFVADATDPWKGRKQASPCLVPDEEIPF